MKQLHIESIALILIRCIFVLVAAGVGVQLVRSETFSDQPVWLLWLIFFGVMLAALAAITIDILFKKKRLDVITAIYFGLIVGLFLTYVLRLALATVFPDQTPLVRMIGLILGMCIFLGYSDWFGCYF